MKALSWILLTALSLPAVAAAADPIDPAGTVPTAETLRYRWRLKGLGGFVANLLPAYPSAGDGVLQVAAGGPARLVSEFLATSEKIAAGQHFVFRSGADLDLGVGPKHVVHGFL